MFNCNFCNKQCKNKNSLAQHVIRCFKNPNRIEFKVPSNKGYCGKNQFIKAREMGSSYIVKESTKEKIRKQLTGKKLQEQHKNNIQKGIQKAIIRNPESYSTQNVQGRVKTYEFNGLKFKGTWELKVAKFLHDKDIKFTNIINPFNYFYNDKEHKYFPDFYLPEYDLFIEVKGYIRDRDYCKWKQVPNLIVIDSQKINNLDEILNFN